MFCVKTSYHDEYVSHTGSLPPPYLYGDQQDIGNAIREIGKHFWDHKTKTYDTVRDEKCNEIVNGHEELPNGIKSSGLNLSPLIGQKIKVENQIT